MGCRKFLIAWSRCTALRVFIRVRDFERRWDLFYVLVRSEMGGAESCSYILPEYGVHTSSSRPAIYAPPRDGVVRAIIITMRAN